VWRREVCTLGALTRTPVYSATRLEQHPIPSLRVAAPVTGRFPPASDDGIRQYWRDPHGTLIASGGSNGDQCWMFWPTVGTFLFDHTTSEIVAHPLVGTTASEIDDTFVRGVLPVAFLAREHEALHASAVLIEDRVVAIGAESGTGKSTLSAAIARCGASHWADDTTLVSFSGPQPRAVCLPFPSRLDAAADSAVSRLAPVTRTTHPGVVAPLAAVYVASQDSAIEAAVSIARVPEVGAFERLLAHAHPFDLTDADRPRRMIERMLHLAAAVPVFELRFRPGLDRLASLADAVALHARSLPA
jgi:hypothetical protein